MDFDFTLEEKMIQTAIRDFVTKEFAGDVVKALDEAGEFPLKYLKKLSKLGFLGMATPEAYKGEGVDIVGTCIVIQELAKSYPALAACYSGIVLSGGAVINELGSEEQKKKYLPGLAIGKLMTALALTEADEDIDGQMITTRVTRLEDGFLLNGQKKYIPLGDVADFYMVLARTGDKNTNAENPGARADASLSLFCVDAKTHGITLSGVETVGNNGQNFVNLEFENVIVSKHQLLGGPDQFGNGRKQLELIQNYTLLGVAAQAVGMAQGAFDYALKHAKTRVQFDQIIGKFTAIREKFTQQICLIDSAKFLVFNAALLASKGKPFSREAALAKSMASKVAVQAAMDGMQVYGGYGYSMEYDIQRYVRDAAGTMSAGISNDFLAQKIAKSLGL
jgi:alkylation response protein AidB-like acyl-CoA dehydrogenase